MHLIQSLGKRSYRYQLGRNQPSIVAELPAVRQGLKFSNMAAVSYNTEKSSVILSSEKSFPSKTAKPSLTTVEYADEVPAGIDARASFLQKVKTFGAIEAYLFLSLFSAAVKNFVDVRLTFVKACVNEVGMSYDECGLLDEHSEAFKEADRIASWYIMVGSWASTVASMIMGILIGSFCDKYQKKVPLLLAPLGFAIESAFSIFCAVYIDSHLMILAVSKAPSGLFGGMMIVLSGTYAYISQVAAPKARQIRFAILQMLVLAGVTIGTVAGGFLFQDKHYVLVYGISIAANVLGMVLLALFMEDKNSKTTDMTYGEIARAFFSIDFLKESYRLVVAPREGNKRLQIWLLIIASFISDIPLTGTRALLLLYVKKRYSWDTETTAYVTGALRLATAFVTIAGVRVFTKKFKMRDSIIALIGFASLAADYLCRGLATSGLMYAMSYVIGALNGCATSASDDLLTRLLHENEIGKVFVFKSLVDLASPAVGTSFFNLISTKFEASVPGAMFISAAMLIIVPTIIMIWILFYGTVAASHEENGVPSDSTVEVEEKDANGKVAIVVSEIRRSSLISRL